MTEEDILSVRESLQLLIRNLGIFQKEGAQCCGLSLVHSHIIYEISKKPGISINDLSTLLGLDKSTMSRHIKSLVERGYVISRPGMEDRRFMELDLTPLGTDFQRQITDFMADYIERIFEKIPAPKRTQVLEGLELLSSAMSGHPMSFTLCCQVKTSL